MQILGKFELLRQTFPPTQIYYDLENIDKTCISYCFILEFPFLSKIHIFEEKLFFSRILAWNLVVDFIMKKKSYIFIHRLGVKQVNLEGRYFTPPLKKSDH